MQNKIKTLMMTLALLVCVVYAGSASETVLVPSPDAVEAPFCINAPKLEYISAKDCSHASVYLRFSDTQAELQIRTSQGVIFKDYTITPDPLYNYIRIRYASGAGIRKVSVLPEHFIPETNLLAIEVKVQDGEFRIYIGNRCVFTDPATKNNVALKITKLGVCGRSAYQWTVRE